MRDLSLYTVAPTDSIRTAMERINQNKHRVVVVVDNGKVLGTVSDGDVRRAFLHDVLPIAPVSQIMHLNPHVTTATDPVERARLLQQDKVTLLPVVNEDNELLDVELAYEPFRD
jgi:mannose-1-phosphate guanylyltransferase/mannose-6-phosphate isomerase